MGHNSIFQTVTEKRKLNLRMFPTRTYKNCRNFSKLNLIDTHVLTHLIIRCPVYYVYVHLQDSVVFATIVMVLYKNIDKIEQRVFEYDYYL